MPKEEIAKKIIIGRFGAVFGLKGWIKVISFTNPPENVLNYQPWLVQQKHEWQVVEFAESKIQHKTIIVRLPDCHEPEQAKTYTNKNIAIEHGALPTLSANEYYWEDLKGLKVINKQNEELGIVDSVMATGANDVLVVMQDRTQRLIPFVKPFILQVDLKERRIMVDWEKDF